MANSEDSSKGTVVDLTQDSDNESRKENENKPSGSSALHKLGHTQALKDSKVTHLSDNKPADKGRPPPFNPGWAIFHAGGNSQALPEGRRKVRDPGHALRAMEEEKARKKADLEAKRAAEIEKKRYPHGKPPDIEDYFAGYDPKTHEARRKAYLKALFSAPGTFHRMRELERFEEREIELFEDLAAQEEHGKARDALGAKLAKRDLSKDQARVGAKRKVRTQLEEKKEEEDAKTVLDEQQLQKKRKVQSADGSSKDGGGVASEANEVTEETAKQQKDVVVESIWEESWKATMEDAAKEENE
jgi:hypothetical protein